MSCEWNATVAVQNTVFESELARYPLADLLFSFFQDNVWVLFRPKNE